MEIYFRSFFILINSIKYNNYLKTDFAFWALIQYKDDILPE